MSRVPRERQWQGPSEAADWLEECRPAGVCCLLAQGVEKHQGDAEEKQKLRRRPPVGRARKEDRGEQRQGSGGGAGLWVSRAGAPLNALDMLCVQKSLLHEQHYPVENENISTLVMALLIP